MGQGPEAPREGLLGNRVRLELEQAEERLRGKLLALAYNGLARDGKVVKLLVQ